MEYKLDTLTPEQDWEFAQLSKSAHELELSTKPLPREHTQTLLRNTYSAAGFAPPQIVWCASPLEMYLSRAIVALMEEFFDPAT